MARTKALFALLLSASLGCLVAACSGSDGSGAFPANAPVPSASATDTPPPDPPDPPSPPPQLPPKKDGGAPDGNVDFDATVPPNTYAKFNPAQPELQSSGGHVLTAPKFQAITFDGDPLRAQIEEYVAKIGRSSYWNATTHEYGIGAGTALAPVHLSETPPTSIDDSAIQTWLSQKIAGAQQGIAPPDDQTLYVVFYPAGTSITLDGTTSCQYFGGYHNEAALSNGAAVSYAVIPRCGDFGGLTGIDAVTFTSSHELFEAATDALPMSNPAYNHVDDDHFVWSYVFMAEGGDLCVEGEILDVRPPDLGFLVQRTWSNAWARAGHHPCAPGGSAKAYFNSAPVLPDTVTVSAYQGQMQVTTKGVKIPVGQTRTIDLQLFSDAPAQDWQVQVVDYAAYVGGGEAELSFSMDRTSGNNGDVIHLSITALKQAQDGFSAFLVESSSGASVNFWPGVVANN